MTHNGKYRTEYAVDALHARGTPPLVLEPRLKLKVKGTIRIPRRIALSFVAWHRGSLVIAPGTLIIGMRRHLILADWPGISDPAAGAVDVSVMGRFRCWFRG